jgi:hypothetical protein
MIKDVDENGKLLKDTRDSLRLTTNVGKEMQSQMKNQKIKIKEQVKRITRLEQAQHMSNVEAINTGTPGGGGDDNDNDKMDEIWT